MSDDMLHQKLSERKARAVILLLSGAVQQTDQPQTYTVQSQHGSGFYVVNTITNTCTCQDEWGRRQLHTCKHIEAARLFELLAQLQTVHQWNTTRFYLLDEGWDVEITCVCGEVCGGFSPYSHKKAHARAVQRWQEHLRLVLEHFKRNPANLL